MDFEPIWNLLDRRRGAREVSLMVTVAVSPAVVSPITKEPDCDLFSAFCGQVVGEGMGKGELSIGLNDT